MKLSKCKACELPVLELEGQFENLDSFYMTDDTPEGTAGVWHTRCLVDSSRDTGAAWYEARLRNFRDVRRYEVVAAPEGWSVVRHPRTKEVFALGTDGTTCGLAFPTVAKQVDGGAVYPVIEEQFHLDLDDDIVVADAQRALLADGTYPLGSLIASMGLSDRMVHPEALSSGGLRYDASLKRHWGPKFVSARMEYGVFVPASLVPYVARAKRS
jgi:hypothetical protein